jgi:hypothetical protein
VYHCNRTTYGANGYGHGVLMNMIEKNKDELLIEIIDKETNFMELNYE